MNTAKQPSRPFAVLHHQPPFALKPLSWVLLTLCASHAFAADNLTLPSGERAGAEGVAVVSEQQTTEESNTAQASTAQAAAKLPSAVDGYTINKATLLAAEATDANPQGVSDAAKANVKPKTSDGAPIDIKLNSVKVRAKRFKDIGPMPGLALTKEQIPGNIQSISAKEIKEAHSLSLSDLLNSKLQSVNVNDYQGNPFQMDVTYRGFTASPQIGSPQGLSVFFDGIRVNEPFGDIVNWDMLPMNALGGFDLFPGSNPLFGLNTLGGALSMKTKSGFTSPGFSAEILGGSYGRKQLQASGGWNSANKEQGSWDGGNYAAFGAVNLFMEDGWRKNSPSKVNQAFGKLEWQGERTSLSFSTLGVVNKLVGNGTVPQELYREDAAAVFTSPDETKNKLLQFQIAGAFDLNDKVNITGMAYHRQSDRYSSTGDIVSADTFQGTSRKNILYKTRKTDPGETPTCAYTDHDKDGVPDYVLVDDANWTSYQFGAGDGLSGAYYGFDDLSLVTGGAYNGALPPEMQTAFKEAFGISPVMSSLVNPNIGSTVPSLNSNSIDYANFLNPQFEGITYIDPNTGTKMHILAKTPPNFASCSALGTGGLGQGGLLLSRDGQIPRDGFNDGSSGFTGTGVVEGTPTAIITKSDIQQTSLGGGLQVNFNLDQHKVMLGASIDQAKASYKGTQRLALLDDNRNVYSDPNQLGDEFYAAQHDIPINDFSGTTTTKSLYASETWSPIQTLNLSFSGRYNLTDVRNTLAPTARNRDLVFQTLTNQFLALWQAGITCPGDNLSNCPFDLSKPIPANYLTEIKRFATLDVAATEKFTYRSFNPAIGATWQAKPNLNLYTNWSQGTRAPSVVELGCAYDGTLVDDPRNHGSLVPRSIAEGRGCSLPSALSGDPYLPQVKAQTVEVGARGKFSEFLEWNVSAYRTDLRDDIYMTSLTPELNFFQSIGDTRRQGIEFGLAGEYGKSDFRINYSLTEATFQSSFKMLSPNNSSRNYVINTPTYQMITVSPGNVMPGVPFNNINFNWGYKVSPKFKVNTSIVGHSDSFLRGNENNAHTPGPGPIVGVEVPGLGIVPRKLPDNFYAGKAPGYAVLNMNARYDFGGGWAFSALMNNVLDKKYYTAGRLGINPFAPSTFGDIGPGRFNYNSGEWIPSQFISPGAPRGVWLSVSYDFDAAKKAVPPAAATGFIEPDRTLDAASNMPTAAELALVKQLDKIKALPVLQQVKAAAISAKQEVTAAVEQWHQAQLDKNAETYLSLYADSFTPAGQSHNHWAELQKMQFVTADVKSVQISKVVVAAEDTTMVAVFTQTFKHSNKQEHVRKILTFQQKHGQWQIVSEHDMPVSNQTLANPSKRQSGFLTDPPPKRNKVKASKINTALNLSNTLNSVVEAK